MENKIKGVTKKGSRWMARPYHNSKYFYLGLYTTQELASSVIHDFLKSLDR